MNARLEAGRSPYFREYQAPKEIDPTTRIVVIGMGVVSSLGNNVPDMWSNITAGKSGIRSIKDVPDYAQMFAPYEQQINASVGGLIVDFSIDPLLKAGVYDRKEKKNLDRSAQYALAATHEALLQTPLIVYDEASKMWRIDTSVIDPDDIAVIYGTGVGGASTIAEVQKRLDKGKTAMPSDILKTLSERSSKVITQTYGIHGSAFAITDACASSNQAMAAGMKEIMVGDAKVVITGGTEAADTPVGFSMFDVMPALSRDQNPATASRPLDKSAAGFNMGAGAGTLVLARLDVAQAMGANIIAEILSYKATSDAGDNVRPDGIGGRKAMRGAWERAAAKGIRGERIFISPHATSTPVGDPVEMAAIADVFGAKKDKVVAISATKSSTGHPLGAAGAIEAVIMLKALETGEVPPTLNLNDPIDEAGGWNLVPHETQIQNPEVGVSNTFGFGGGNVTIVVEKY